MATSTTNIPAIQNGDAILTAIQTLTTTVEGLNTSMTALETRMTALETRMTALETRMTTLETGVAAVNTRLIDANFNALNQRLQASEFNNVARLQNSVLAVRPSSILEPLHNVQNGSLILNFPTTLSEIRGMHAARLDSILDALGQETNGTIEARKERLRKAIGVRGQPA